MSRQTAAPFDHISLNPTHRTAKGLVDLIHEGALLLDPPYQRGSVWTEGQRIALVESWLRGLPAGVVILADRGTEKWRKANRGADPYETGKGIWAVVDGKQRLTTAIEWFGGGFAIPASWIPVDFVDGAEDTDDGLYVRYSGLTRKGQRFMENYCSLMVAETKDCATEAHEAAFYLLVNGGGTPQSDADMANAARVADPQQSAPERTPVNLDRIVAYRVPNNVTVLLCRQHGHVVQGTTPITARELSEGGICTFGRATSMECGRDVLID